MDQRKFWSARGVRTAALFLCVWSSLFCGATGMSLAAADRGVSMISASVTEFANHLFLSQLMGQPTVLRTIHQKFCVDVMNPQELEDVFQRKQEFIKQGFWSLKCTPVKPEVTKIRNGQYAVSLTFLNLNESQKWLEKLRVVSSAPSTQAIPLVSRERQLELVKLYGSSSKQFDHHNNPKSTDLLLGNIAKVRRWDAIAVDRDGRL